MSAQEELASTEVGKTEKGRGPPPEVGLVHGDLLCETSDLENKLVADDLPYKRLILLTEEFAQRSL